MRLLVLLALAGCGSSSFCDVREGGTPKLSKTAGDCPDPPIYFAVVNGGGELPYHLMLSPECVTTQRAECSIDALCNDSARIHADGENITLKAPACSGTYKVSY